MVQNTFLDQVLEQEPLVLTVWEQDEQAASAAPAGKPMPSCRVLLRLYDIAVTLLLLTSLAAIVACFVRMN